MKTFYLLIVCALLSVSACSQWTGRAPVEVTYDYNVTIDFSGLKTFSWYEEPGGVEIDQLVIPRIKNAIETTMQTKGLELSVHNPDFLIAVYGGTRQEYSTTWKGWDDELWYDEGRLKLQFFDTRSSKVIWWAETRADMYYQMPPEEKNTLVSRAVARLLDKFPPKSSE